MLNVTSTWELINTNRDELIEKLVKTKFGGIDNVIKVDNGFEDDFNPDDVVFDYGLEGDIQISGSWFGEGGTDILCLDGDHSDVNLDDIKVISIAGYDLSVFGYDI